MNWIDYTFITDYCQLSFQDVLCTRTLLIKIIKEKCSEAFYQPHDGQQWFLHPLILIQFPVQLCLCCLSFEKLFLDHVFSRPLFLHTPLLAWIHVFKSLPQTRAVCSLPHGLWSNTGFTGTTLKTWPHVLPMKFTEQIFRP